MFSVRKILDLILKMFANDHLNDFYHRGMHFIFINKAIIYSILIFESFHIFLLTTTNQIMCGFLLIDLQN